MRYVKIDTKFPENLQMDLVQIPLQAKIYKNDG